MGVTMAISVFPVAPTGAGAGPRPGAAASWQSLDPCTWSSYTSASSPATRSSLKRQVFSLLPPQTAPPPPPHREQKGGHWALQGLGKGSQIGGVVYGEQSPLSYCGRPDCTQSQAAGKASSGSSRDPAEGRKRQSCQEKVLEARVSFWQPLICGSAGSAAART